MASKQEVNVEAKDAKLTKLFTQLDSLLKNEASLKSTLRLIDFILAVAPNDNDALKCKAVVYVRDEEFQKALQLIHSNPTVAEDLAFEQAYCHYRLGQMEQALKAVGAVGEGRLQARLQLEAQLHYKLGDFAAASTLYLALFREHKVDTQELQSNTVAAYVCNGQAAEVPQLKREMQISGESSEVGFNLACALLQQGALSNAEQQLQLALRAGKEQLLLEELDEAAIAEELAPFTAQLAFTHSCLGLEQQAADEYQSLGATDDLDTTTAAVVRNNRAAAAASVAAGGAAPKKGAQEALRRLERLMASSGTHLEPALESRLLDSQKQEILANRVLLMAAANKQDAAQTALSTLQRRFPDFERLSLLQAALLTVAGKTHVADEALQQAEKQASSIDVACQAVLMRAQLAATHGNRSTALSALCALPDEARRQQPAVVATIVHLQEAERDTAGAVRTLEAALEWWRSAMDHDTTKEVGSRPQNWILQQLVKAKVAAGKVEEAQQLYNEMGREGGTTAHIAAQAEALTSLATIIALQGGSGIEGLDSRLPPLEPMDVAEVARLESAPAASVARRVGASTAVKDDEAEAQKKRRRKKRKPRYPAGFDPENPGPPPNPERWLPKWQRSEFKKQRKAMEKRRAAGREIKGSQGKGLVDESLDISQQSRPRASVPGPSLPGRTSGKTASRRKGRR